MALSATSTKISGHDTFVRPMRLKELEYIQQFHTLSFQSFIYLNAFSLEAY